MIRLFSLLTTAYFLVLNIILFFGIGYGESLLHIFYIPLVVFPFGFFIRKLWVRKLSHIGKFSILSLLTGLLFMLFPGGLSFFLMGYHRSTGFLFKEGVYRYFNNASTGEVTMFQVFGCYFIMGLIMAYKRLYGKQ